MGSKVKKILLLATIVVCILYSIFLFIIPNLLNSKYTSSKIEKLASNILKQEVRIENLKFFTYPNLQITVAL